MRAMTLLSAVGSALLLAAQPALSQENAAEKAVEAAKQYSGVTLNTAEEAGLLAMLGININGPEWEELTGISVQVNEIPFEELFTKQMLEHRAGSGAYDVMLVGPSWVADMARGGALEPLDAYIEEYGVAEEFDDIAPAFKDWMTYDGKTYGLVIDGDVHLLYYRKDIFDDPENKEAFKAEYGYDLGPPETWKAFGEICQFITDKYAPETYGAGLINTGYMHFFFSERLRTYGGKFFDPETMEATVNSQAGIDALTDMVNQLDCQPPGVQTWGFGESLSALNSGEIAMTITWPPVARWAQGINADEQALSWVPESTVVDKIGYALPPGGHPELASGFLLAVSPDSKNKEAAYLYIQWLHSKQESLKNVMRPLGLRDPFRISHYESEEFRNLWPTAGEYLDILKVGGEQGYADLAILETYKYWDSMARAVTAAIGGKDPKQALDELAAEWDGLTEQIGVDRQKEAYANWASKPSAYRE
ncbi:ABC transporter substrate-binding protein [Bauldia litoralis]|uniref:ABC transporter substrate-binding protein n=3 Tax=Hyphomicrobiales TaxID=356 RepID=UPI00326409BB